MVIKWCGSARPFDAKLGGGDTSNEVLAKIQAQLAEMQKQLDAETNRTASLRQEIRSFKQGRANSQSQSDDDWRNYCGR